jgi:hypothetical protein
LRHFIVHKPDRLQVGSILMQNRRPWKQQQPNIFVNTHGAENIRLVVVVEEAVIGAKH